MNKRPTWQEADTHRAISKFNELLIELEIAEFRARSMIDYHESKMIGVNDDLKELHNYMIDFYNDMIIEIKQRRLEL